MPADPQRIQAIFASAVQKSQPERAAFLERECAGDSELRRRVDALILAHEQSGSFLDAPPKDLAGTSPTIVQSLPEQAGSLIGPYKLLQQIGEGGMGTVFMAEQLEPVERRVALKIVKPGMDTKAVIARFEAERQALAMMDHPNIAKVLDVGTTNSGRPYFVMELVRGVSITQYCDEHRLTPRERLELFLPVCQAVQHAHQKGIIHRDIKPSNVLVTQYDDRPVPKIIDFCLARAMEKRLTAKTMFTEFGQVVGTPDYMSPEQAKLNQMDIDTRSDIYSLGVLLYELLSGNTPFDRQRMRSAAFDELLRIIREEEPPRPSQRLSTVDTLPSIAAKRHITPAELTRQLSGELDWIVMKTLEKDRSRRYETANGLAADLRRYLANEPVEACPPSTAYRFRKFARRNKGLLATTGMIAAALLLGAVLSTWQAVRATRAERLADARFEAEVTARAAEAQQRKVAEDQRREAEQQQKAAEANFQQARKAVDEYFTLVSESTLLDVPGLQPLRRDLMESALRFYQQSALDRSDNPEVLADLAVTHLRLSQIYISLNRNDDGIAAINSALDAIDHLHRAFPRSADYDRRLGGFWRGMRWSQASTQMPQDPQSALKTLVHLEDTWQQLADEYPNEVAFRVDQGPINALLGALCVSMGQPRDGIAFFRKAIAIVEPIVADEPNVPAHRADLAIVIGLLANVLYGTGDLEEADMLIQQAVQLGEQLVIEEPNVPAHRNYLAQNLIGLGGLLERSNPEEAEQARRRGIEMHEALAAEFPAAFLYHERLHKAQIGFLSWLIAQGRDKDVEQLDERIRQSLVRLEKAAVDFSFNIDHPHYLSAAHVDLGKQLQAINRPADALAAFRKALEIAQNVAADSPNDRPTLRSLGHSARMLGFHLKKQSQDAEAEKAFLIGVKAFEDGVTNPSAVQDDNGHWLDLHFAADTHRYLGQGNMRLDKLPEAENHFRKAVELSGGLPAAFILANPKQGRWVAQNYVDYGKFLRSQNRLDDAVEVLRQGVDFFARLSAEFPNDAILLRFQAAEVWHLRGDCLHSLSRYEDAIRDYDEAIRLGPSHTLHVLPHRGMAHAKLMQLDQAADDLREGLKLGPEQKWILPHLLDVEFARGASNETTRAIAAESKSAELAFVDAVWNLLLDRQEEFEQARRAITSRLAQSEIHRELYLVARIDALTRNPMLETGRLVEIAQQVVNADPTAWHLHTAGLCLLRDGQEEAAIERFHQSLGTDWNGAPANRLGLAIAHSAVGQSDEAQDWLKKAREWFGEHPLDLSSELHAHDRLACQLLLRESEERIEQTPVSSP